MCFTLLVVWNTSFFVAQPPRGQGSVLSSTDGMRTEPWPDGVRNFDSREGFQVEAEETGLQQAMREEKWVTKKRGGKCQEGPGVETWYLCTFPLDGPWLCLPGVSIQMWLIDNQIISVFGGSHLNQEKIEVFKIKKHLFEICYSKLDFQITIKFYSSYSGGGGVGGRGSRDNFVLLHLIPLEKKSLIWIYLGLSGVCASLYKAFGGGLHPLLSLL